MQVTTELTKLIVVVLVVLSGAVLTATGSIGSDAGVGIIMTGAGYVFGNGHGIATAQRAIQTRIDELARAGVVERRDDEG